MEKQNTERYIGYGKLLNLPSKRVGLELSINDLEELLKEAKKGKGIQGQPIRILVLPVKEHNVTNWRTHSVKIAPDNQQTLINEH